MPLDKWSDGRRRELHLCANVLATGRHNAAWRLSGQMGTETDIDHFLAIARIAEAGTFDAVFFADRSSLDDNAPVRPWAALDPALLLTSMAAATECIGLVATASTTFEHPYHVARRFASLDHLSGGRAAWNIVTTHHNAVAGNFGLDGLPEHEDRYERAEEFADVVVKLWGSWKKGAVVADPQTGRYLDLSRITPVSHDGKYFSVHGQFQVPPTPQGRPVIFQAGSSTRSQTFGARLADAIFTVERTLENARHSYDTVRNLATEFGRNPDTVRVMPGLYPILGSTEAEALRRKSEMDDLLDLEESRRGFSKRFGIELELINLDKAVPADLLDHAKASVSRGFLENIVRESLRDRLTFRDALLRNALSGHRVLIGTPEQIADDIELWFSTGAADGFNLNFDSYPDGLQIFVDHVVPELRRRHLFRQHYSSRRLRDHLGLSYPAENN